MSRYNFHVLNFESNGMKSCFLPNSCSRIKYLFTYTSLLFIVQDFLTDKGQNIFAISTGNVFSNSIIIMMAFNSWLIVSYTDTKTGDNIHKLSTTTTKYRRNIYDIHDSFHHFQNHILLNDYSLGFFWRGRSHSSE